MRCLPWRTERRICSSDSPGANAMREGPAPRAPPGWHTLQLRVKTDCPRSRPGAGWCVDVGTGDGVGVAGLSPHDESARAPTNVEMTKTERRSLVLKCPGANVIWNTSGWSHGVVILCGNPRRTRNRSPGPGTATPFYTDHAGRSSRDRQDITISQFIRE